MGIEGPRALEGLMALCASALERGAVRKSQMAIDWDVAGRCERPVHVELYARPSGVELSGRLMTPKGMGKMMRLVWRRIGVEHGTAHPLWLRIDAPCRRCYRCRAKRAAYWKRLAESEVKAAPRTWFCTFTLRPEEQFRATLMCVTREQQNGVVFEELSDDEQYRVRCTVLGPEVTKYLKRVRKNSGAPLRYLWVAEKHKSGLPHYHALVHEVDPARPVRYRHLEEAWTLGFMQAKIVQNPDQAGYLCKYLAKEAGTRVRSSLMYGRLPPSATSESEEKLTLTPQR